MANRDKLPLFPSRANFVTMKLRITSASKGLSLLKRKRDALELHLREKNRELQAQQEKVSEQMDEAIFSVAKAKFYSTDLKPASVQSPDRADAYLRVKMDNIIGVVVPSLNLVLRPTTALAFTGLATGGRQVEEVRYNFQEALKVLTALASLEFSVQTLSQAVRQTNMRVNGLEYVLLPRFTNTLVYIGDELEEFEREDFYRLKRSQSTQRKKRLEGPANIAKSLQQAKKVTESDPDIDLRSYRSAE